jgi:hypothetical protein
MKKQMPKMPETGSRFWVQRFIGSGFTVLKSFNSSIPESLNHQSSVLWHLKPDT